MVGGFATGMTKGKKKQEIPKPDFIIANTEEPDDQTKNLEQVDLDGASEIRVSGDKDMMRSPVSEASSSSKTSVRRSQKSTNSQGSSTQGFQSSDYYREMIIMEAEKLRYIKKNYKLKKSYYKQKLEILRSQSRLTATRVPAASSRTFSASHCSSAGQENCTHNYMSQPTSQEGSEYMSMTNLAYMGM